MKRRLKPPQRKFEAASLLSSRVSSRSSQALPEHSSGSSRMKAVRAGESEILLPRSHPSAASAASDRLAGGRLEGAALARDPLDSGSAGRCQLLLPCCPGAAGSHLPGRPPLTSSWQSRERAREGAGRGGGGTQKLTPPPGQTDAGLPPSCSHPPTNGVAGVGSYANLQRPGHSLRKAQSSPHPPSTALSSPFPLLQIPFPISLLCGPELVLDKWEDGRGICNQALSLIMHLRD